MKRIPIKAAKQIAKDYGYDQVIIYARKVGQEPEVHGEHMTSYGVNKAHCAVAARMAATLQRFMGWPEVAKTDETIEVHGPVRTAEELEASLGLPRGSYAAVIKVLRELDI